MINLNKDNTYLKVLNINYKVIHNDKTLESRVDVYLYDTFIGSIVNKKTRTEKFSFEPIEEFKRIYLNGNSLDDLKLSICNYFDPYRKLFNLELKGTTPTLEKDIEEDFDYFGKSKNI